MASEPFSPLSRNVAENFATFIEQLSFASMPLANESSACAVESTPRSMVQRALVTLGSQPASVRSAWTQ